LPSRVSFTGLPACKSRSAARVIRDASIVDINVIIPPASGWGEFEDLSGFAVTARRARKETTA
jgi:hypothetical protein